MADTRNDARLICFNLHAAAAAEALLAAPQLMVDKVNRDRNTGGQAGESGYQALAV